MAVTNEQINAYLAANPGMGDAEIAAAMTENKVTPAQMAQVTGLGQDVVQARYDAATAPALSQIANTPGIGAQGNSVNIAPTTGALAQAAPAYDFSTNLGQYIAVKTGDKDLIAQALAANTQGDVYDRAYLTSVLGKEFADSYFSTPTTNIARDSNSVAAPVVQVASGATQTAADIANTSGLGAQGIGVDTSTSVDVKDEVSDAFESVFGREPTASELTGLRSTYGMTIEPGELNQIVLSKRDANVGYGVATTQAVTPIYGVKEVIDENGELTQVTTITGYKDQNGNAVDPSLVSTEQVGDSESGYQTVYNVAVDPLSFSGGVVGKLTKQILDQGNTQYFSGEGYGSADKNVADMALLLAAAGITDINQFGKVSVAADAAVTPIYEQKLMYDPELGEYMAQTIVGYKDASGKAVDPSLVKTIGNEDGSVEYLAPVGTKQVFGNTATGKAIDSNYAKANDDIFSGTFAGEGSTGYGVKFKADGSPVFYTQFMGSSNDLAQLLDDPLIGSIVQAAASYFGGPLGTAALNLVAGRDVDDVAKAVITSYVAGEVGKFVSGAESVVDTLGKTGANIAGNVAGSVASGGGKEGALQALITGGVNVALPAVTTLIPGYENLTSTQKSFVDNIVSNTLRDGDLSASDVINAAVTSGKEAVRTAVNDKLGETAFVDSKRTGATDQEAFDASDALTRIANANETFDGSALGSQNEAMNAALADGKDKFTFGGKTFSIDNSAAVAAEFTKSVLADAKAETDLRVKSDSEFGDLAGAITDATARNTVTIGNAEANDLTEAAALAKIRDPSATSFTFGGKTYTVSASQSEMSAANKTATLAEIKDLPKFSDAFAQARTLLGPNQTFEWNGKQYSTATAAERPDLNITSADQAIQTLNATNLATTTPAQQALIDAQTDTVARDAAAVETARLANLSANTQSMGNTSFLGQIYKDLNEKFKLQGVAANEYLANNPNSPITNSISTAFEAAGNLQKNVGGGTALLLNNKPLSDALVKGGDNLTKLGQSIGTGPQDTQNWNDTLGLINKATGFEKVAVIAGRIMDGTSGLGRQVEVELRQELPGMFLGGGSLKAVMLATGTMDTAETAGNAALDAYENAVKNGKNHNDALSDARKAGAVAGATEAAVQLTLGKVADVVAGKFGNVAGRTGAKVAGEGIVEGGQEGGAALAVDLALGNELDANKYLTQTVVGGAVGKGAATATSGVDVAQTDSINNSISTAVASGDTATVSSAITSSVQTSLSGGASVEVAVGKTVGAAITNGADAATSINNVVTTAIEGGADTSQVVASTITSAASAGADTSLAINSTVTSAITGGADASQVVASAITAGAGSSVVTGTVISSTVSAAVTAGADAAATVNSSVTAAVGAGGNVSTVVESSVSAAITAGASVATAVDSAVTAAATAGVSVDAAVASSVAAAVTTGADVNTAVTAAVDAAVASGNNVTVASDANVVTINNATTNTNTTVDTATGVTTTVDNANNVTTVVDGNTSTVVDANANTTAQTTVDGNTQTTVVADANSNTNTQTVVDTKTNTTTSTTVDNTTNATTQTTITADTQTTVLTDPTTNTQTTVKVNINTGDVIDVKEVEIPADWTPPVIKAPEVKPPTVTTLPTAVAEEVVDKTSKPKPKLPGKGGGAGGAGGAGLPLGIDVDPASLRSKVTGDAIDPLARVKQAQAELERDVMMNQMDPQLLAVMQRRLDPQQQTKQFDNDIGALAKVLGGEAEAPANQSKYYSYGAEDSIDDILGGKAANYAAGGYVEPLKASGGSMALPLMAKSGGALGKYNGRENFKDGKHVAGEGDGQSDDIPAWLADGEFVFPADVVSALGNGSTKAGTDKLYDMMHSIRDRARSKGPKDLPPPALKSPLDYLKSSKRSAK